MGHQHDGSCDPAVLHPGCRATIAILATFAFPVLAAAKPASRLPLVEGLDALEGGKYADALWELARKRLELAAKQPAPRPAAMSLLPTARRP